MFLAYVFTTIILTGGFIQFSMFALPFIILEGMEKASLKNINKYNVLKFITCCLAFCSSLFIIIPTIEAGIYSQRKLLPYYSGLLPDVKRLIEMFLYGNSSYTAYPDYFYYLGIVVIMLAIYYFSNNIKKVISKPAYLYSLIYPFIVLMIYCGIFSEKWQFGVASDPFRGFFIFIFVLSMLAASGYEKIIENLKINYIDKKLIIISVFGILLTFLFMHIFFGILFLSIFLALFILTTIEFSKFNCYALVQIFKMVLPNINTPGYILKFKIRQNIYINVFISGIFLLLIFNFIPYSIDYLRTNVVHSNMDKINTLQCLKNININKHARIVSISNDQINEWGVYNKLRMLGGYGSFFPVSVFERMKHDKLFDNKVTALTHFNNDKNLNPHLMAEYGVAYLLDNTPAKKQHSENLTNLGWKKIINSPTFIFYTNPYYIGRAYILSGSNIDRNKTIKIETDNNHRVDIKVDTNSKNMTLILADSWYPGWICYDNGKKIKGFNSNGFRACLIKKTGKHTVSWIYDPTSFKYGSILSIISLALFILLLIFLGLNKKSLLFKQQLKIKI